VTWWQWTLCGAWWGFLLGVSLIGVSGVRFTRRARREDSHPGSDA
jgi:hypothetical protein